MEYYRNCEIQCNEKLELLKGFPFTDTLAKDGDIVHLNLSISFQVDRGRQVRLQGINFWGKVENE